MEKIRVSKHEYQVLMHNLTVIGLIVLFVHVMLTSSSRMSSFVRMVYIIYFAIGICFYIYHKVIRLLILRKNIFLVNDIVKESQNVWTIKFSSEKRRIFSYKPGQFCFVRFLGDSIEHEEHPFSISSSPDQDFLSITVKELGDFTSQIKNLEVGQKAIIDAPYGKFSYLDHSDEKGIALIVGGVGITPALGMLRHALATKEKKQIILMWGINEHRDLIHADEFAEMEREMKNFKFIPVMFKDDSWRGERGAIDRNRIRKLFSEYDVKPDLYGFYVCGPALMSESVVKALKAEGVRHNKIHYEKFSI